METSHSMKASRYLTSDAIDAMAKKKLQESPLNGRTDIKYCRLGEGWRLLTKFNGSCTDRSHLGCWCKDCIKEHDDGIEALRQHRGAGEYD